MGLKTYEKYILGFVILLVGAIIIVSTLHGRAQTACASGSMMIAGASGDSECGQIPGLTVGATNTGAAGSSASVTNSGTSVAPILNFTVPAGAVGANGSQGGQGNTGSTGATGPAGLGTVAPSNPTRSLNTAFQPSVTKATMVHYSVSVSVTNPLLVGTSTATCQLLSDANANPTTIQDTAATSSGVGLTVTVALTTGNTVPLGFIVPTGWYVKISCATTGTGTTTLVNSSEEQLG